MERRKLETVVLDLIRRKCVSIHSLFDLRKTIIVSLQPPSRVTLLSTVNVVIVAAWLLLHYCLFWSTGWLFGCHSRSQMVHRFAN